MPLPSGTADPNDISQYKGVISPCPHCNSTESRLSQSACPYCMSRRYLAACTNCNGSGMVSAGSVWDGGRSQHRSTCAPCAGKGSYPASESDYIRQQATNPVTPEAASAAITHRPLPHVVRPMNNLEITRYPK